VTYTLSYNFNRVILDNSSHDHERIRRREKLSGHENSNEPEYQKEPENSNEPENSKRKYKKEKDDITAEPTWLRAPEEL
jgi:hypothetical protein